MSIVAIMVDGGFFQKRAQYLWKDATPAERASQMMAYCMKHINYHDHLYRIFYYDCPPSSKVIYHPLLQRQIFLAKSSEYAWMIDFQEELKRKRKVALRLGRLSEIDVHYNLKADITKKLCTGKILPSDLTERDFDLNIKQKGVDMKLGVDIASVAYKKQVNKIILIAGDSDFVPAAKLARREGIDFVLDPMGAGIAKDLSEHIDGLVTPAFVPRKDVIEAESEDELDLDEC